WGPEGASPRPARMVSSTAPVRTHAMAPTTSSETIMSLLSGWLADARGHGRPAARAEFLVDDPDPDVEHEEPDRGDHAERELHERPQQQRHAPHREVRGGFVAVGLQALGDDVVDPDEDSGDDDGERGDAAERPLGGAGGGVEDPGSGGGDPAADESAGADSAESDDGERDALEFGVVADGRGRERPVVRPRVPDPVDEEERGREHDERESDVVGDEVDGVHGRLLTFW